MIITAILLTQIIIGIRDDRWDDNNTNRQYYGETTLMSDIPTLTIRDLVAMFSIQAVMTRDPDLAPGHLIERCYELADEFMKSKPVVAKKQHRQGGVVNN